MSHSTDWRQDSDAEDDEEIDEPVRSPKLKLASYWIAANALF
jgi:hypothetical protein